MNFLLLHGQSGYILIGITGYFSKRSNSQVRRNPYLPRPPAAFRL